jgi:hypothetical protein
MIFPTQTVIVLAVVAAIGVGGYTFGYRNAANSYKAVQLKFEREMQAEKDVLIARNNELAHELEVAKRERKVVYRTIEKKVDRIVTRDVYRNVCIDPDGLRIVNEALAGTRATASEPDAAVPAADAAGRDDRR